MDGEMADAAAAAEAAAVDFVAEYLGLKATIADLEAKAKEARDAISTLLQGPPGSAWAFPGIGRVDVVKGQVREKLDRAILAAGGVAKELLDKATVRTEGEPSLRITAEKQNTKAA